MKLCFSSLGCPDWTLRQIAEAGEAYGFDGVELRISGNQHVNPNFDQEQRRETRKLFAAHGLPIAILSGYTRFCGEDVHELTDYGESLLQNARLAADLHVPYVRTFLGGDFTVQGAETLYQYCNKAKALGVMVLMEIHDSLRTGQEAADLLRIVNSEGLAILWDIEHSLSELEQPHETWQAAGQQIFHVHVKDVTADRQPCLMGEGILPVPEIVALLKRNDYAGYCSFEWEKTWFPELEAPEVAFPHFIKYMKENAYGVNDS